MPSQKTSAKFVSRTRAAAFRSPNVHIIQPALYHFTRCLGFVVYSGPKSIYPTIEYWSIARPVFRML